MKWEVYEKMDDAKRDYWNFNFKDKPQVSIPYLSLIVILTSLSLLVFTVYLIQSDKLPAMYDQSVTSLLYFIGQFTKVYCLIGLVEYLLQIVCLGIHTYQEKKWLKSQGLI